jgi:hypothetical protein
MCCPSCKVLLHTQWATMCNKALVNNTTCTSSKVLLVYKLQTNLQHATTCNLPGCLCLLQAQKGSWYMRQPLHSSKPYTQLAPSQLVSCRQPLTPHTACQRQKIDTALLRKAQQQHTCGMCTRTSCSCASLHNSASPPHSRKCAEVHTLAAKTFLSTHTESHMETAHTHCRSLHRRCTPTCALSTQA